jgi:hypothetical protein
MGWERRGNRLYFYAATRVGDRVVKRYVGAGEVAELAARLDALGHDERDSEADARRRAREELAELDAALAPLDELADAAVAAALVAAGFHRHHRGPWRKRRA